MPKIKRNFYQVLDKKTKYRYGAFEHTPGGRKEAKDYIEKLEKKTGLKYFIK